ncbi:MAG: hypothetical protein ACT4PZ_23525 [Panacagrimonas sp.]
MRNVSFNDISAAVNAFLTVAGLSDTYTSVTAPITLAVLLGLVFKVIADLVGGVLGYR